MLGHCDIWKRFTYNKCEEETLSIAGSSIQITVDLSPVIPWRVLGRTAWHTELRCFIIVYSKIDATLMPSQTSIGRISSF